MKTDLTLVSVRIADRLLEAREYILGVKCTTADIQAVLFELAPLGNIKIRAWRIGPFVILKRRRKQ